jgi:hypothetical protein
VKGHGNLPQVSGLLCSSTLASHYLCKPYQHIQCLVLVFEAKESASLKVVRMKQRASAAKIRPRQREQ